MRLVETADYLVAISVSIQNLFSNFPIILTTILHKCNLNGNEFYLKLKLTFVQKLHFTFAAWKNDP